MFNSSALGGRLEQIQKQQGLTQGELCELLNVSRTSLQLYIKGKRDIPVSALAKLFDKYSVDPVWMMYGDEKGGLTSFERSFFEQLQEIDEKLRKKLADRNIQLNQSIRLKVIKHVYSVLKISSGKGIDQVKILGESLDTALELVG